MPEFTFDETMILRALEANAWRNVWDIYWIDAGDAAPPRVLTTEDAFRALLKDKNLLPASNGATPPHG